MAAAEPDNTAIYLKHARTALIGILLFCVLFAIYFARDFLLPVTIACLIAMTFRPLIRWFAHRHVPAWVTASAFAIMLLAGGLVAGYLVSGPISGWIAEAPQTQRIFLAKVSAISGPLQRFVQIAEDLRASTQPAEGTGPQQVVVSPPSLPALLWTAAGYPAGFTVMFTGAVVLSLFLMASGDMFYEKMVHAMPTLTDKKNALRLVHDVEGQVSAYLITLTAINAGVGIAVGFAFYLLGMPAAYLWAFPVFALNFIPYAGPLAGVALAALSAIVVFDSFSYALLAPIIYTAIVTVENQLVSPYILSHRLQLNAVAILLALAFWAWMWGIIGIVVAVPLLVILKVFSSHITALASIGAFLGESEAAPSSDVTPPAGLEKT
jgi:predicted PurR-regulated permease PerM